MSEEVRVAVMAVRELPKSHAKQKHAMDDRDPSLPLRGVSQRNIPMLLRRILIPLGLQHL
jgi:hypothetical protein